VTEELQRMFQERIQGGSERFFRFLEIAFLATGARLWLANENASNPARRFFGICGLRQFPGNGGGNIFGNDLDVSLGKPLERRPALEGGGGCPEPSVVF
jgi:hypothetical protein